MDSYEQKLTDDLMNARREVRRLENELRELRLPGQIHRMVQELKDQGLMEEFIKKLLGG